MLSVFTMASYREYSGFFFAICVAISCVAAQTCDYAACPAVKSDMLNVHLVAHTHDDVGWLKTVDQYYYGSEQNIQNAGVQYILDSVVNSLANNPDRRFIYVESAFFWRWWRNQDETKRNLVKTLVNEGRLTFIGGGWSMNDEAATHYTSIIDNMSYGLRFLNNTFGTCGLPRVAWQIDPFGHGKEQANLFAQIGFDALLFGRLDYEDYNNRAATKTMETIWEASDSLGGESWLFTSALKNMYQPPSGFCFDIMCGEQPIRYDPKLHDYNVNRKVDQFLGAVASWAQPYSTNHILMTMGSDFQYQAADTWFINLDKLIEFTNARQANGSKVNVIYSTPACYVKSVNALGNQWTNLTSDFFPYGSDSQSYWTGYYTSRPAQKRYERISDIFLQACKQVSAYTPLDEATLSQVDNLREPMGILQHHDAVAGTEKQAVAFDYNQRLSVGQAACAIVINQTTNYYISQDGAGSVDVTFCPLLNLSRCDTLEKNDQVVVSYYNPLPRSVTAYIRIPVTSKDHVVYRLINGTEASAVSTDLVPVPDAVVQQGQVESSSSNSVNLELLFIDTLPPLGYNSYYVTREQIRSRQTKQPIQKKDKRDDTILDNGVLQVSVDGVTGKVKSVTRNSVQYPLDQEFYYYIGQDGSDGRASGAYVFRPVGTEPTQIAEVATFAVYQGEYVTEIQQNFTSWVSQVVRLYKGANFLEFEWMVGPIPIDDNNGKEVITRYITDLKSNGMFYVDSNGRQMVPKQLNTRFSYPYTVTEPVAGNYNPITSRVSIQESKGRRIDAIVDRAEGATSLTDGTIEVMLHRRLLHDDGFGVGEPLNETAFGSGLVVRGKHRLFFASQSDSDYGSGARILQVNSVNEPVTTYHATDLTFDDYSADYNMQGGYLSNDEQFPANVHLLTFERVDNRTLLIRLENPFDASEDPQGLSQQSQVSLAGILRGFKVNSIREATLGGNQWLDEAERLTWTSTSGESSQTAQMKEKRKQQRLTPTDTITLQPSQIRTFLADVELLF